MKNIVALLAATAAVGLATTVYAADESANSKTKVEYKDDGGYESSRSATHTDVNGTKQTSKSKVDVDVDSDGKVEKTVKSESTTDAKGLLNKKTNTVKSTVEETANGGYEAETTSKHTDAAGTNTKTEVSKDVDVDASGNVTETTKTEKVVDPKGLMNKEKTTSKTKVVNGKVVEDTTTSK